MASEALREYAEMIRAMRDANPLGVGDVAEQREWRIGDVPQAMERALGDEHRGARVEPVDALRAD